MDLNANEQEANKVTSNQTSSTLPSVSYAIDEETNALAKEDDDASQIDGRLNQNSDDISQKISLKDRFLSRRKKNPTIHLSGDYDHSLGEVLSTPTHPKHLGIFQFMPFEHQENDEKSYVIEDKGEQEHKSFTRKKKLRHVLHSKALHIIIILLVLIDSILVIMELLFDLNAFGEEAKEHVIREVFHGFSIGILSMFMIELGLKLWADYTHFIRHKIEILDAAVVVVSWIIDIILVFKPSEGLVAAELLVILRLWRVFRIVNGLIVAVKTKADERVHLFKMENDELHAKLSEAEKELKILKSDVRLLKAKLDEYGVKVD